MSATLANRSNAGGEVRQALNSDVSLREVWAWAMYDFANSGYTTVVLTTIFNQYFVRVVAGDAPWATLAWTVAIAVSYAVIMFSAPAVGAFADVHAAKKRLLLVMTIGCVLATAALALVGKGDLWWAVALLVASNFFYGSGENLAGAFLPELAKGKALGKVSGWGWSIGYLGGLTALIACLIIVKSGVGVQWTMVTTAVVFALASIPTFMFLRERAVPRRDVSTFSLTGDAFRQLRLSLRDLQRFPDLARFLVCLVVYQSGIAAVISLTAIYAAKVLGFNTEQTIKLILVANISAAIGALAFGYVQDRIGHLRTIGITLAIWVVTVLAMAMSQGLTTFWIAANLAGFSMGACQSAGRAMVALLSPGSRRAEFFGLWGFAAKFSGILGPLTYGVANWLSGGNHRLSLLITGSFFVVGLALLTTIDVKRGVRAALREARQLGAAANA